MDYIESINNAYRVPLAPTIVPTEIVDHALSLRFSEQVKGAGADAVHRLGLTEVSPEDRRLFSSRIVGGMATKLALASYGVSNLPTFYELPELDQYEQLKIMTEKYADIVQERLTGDEDMNHFLYVDQTADPLPDVANAKIRSILYTSRSATISPSDRLRMVLSYLNPTPGTFPPTPYAILPSGKNDSVLVQAFGRDSIRDKELISIREHREELQSDDAMMEYLDTIDFQPGPSNEALADEIDRQLHLQDTPEQIVQWEVAYALRSSHPEVYSIYRNYIHILWPHSGFYPTHEVKRDSVKTMDQLGLHNPKELAHGDMMVRALGILNKLGVVADPVVADIPFDALSTQSHVRSERAWVPRETLARVEHVVRGRVKF